MNTLLDDIKNYVKMNGGTYVDIVNEGAIINIHNFMVYGIICDDNDDITQLYYGYICGTRNEHDQMMMWWAKSSRNGNDFATSNVGAYYCYNGFCDIATAHWIKYRRWIGPITMSEIIICVTKYELLEQFLKMYDVGMFGNDIKTFEIVMHFINNDNINDRLLDIYCNFDIMMLNNSDIGVAVNILKDVLHKKIEIIKV